MSKYTEEVRKAVAEIAKGIPVTVDVMEYEDELGEFYGLRIYSYEWNSFDQTDFKKALTYLITMRKTMESFGLLVTLEPVEGGPE